MVRGSGERNGSGNVYDARRRKAGDFAGVGPEDVDLTISNKGALTVSGIIRPDSDGEKIYNLEDLNFEAFRKVVNLPVGYENAEGRATFKDGILEVSIEKSESEEEVRQLRIENS
jgi:HSP20 family molecular chaperone IbpA